MVQQIKLSKLKSKHGKKKAEKLLSQQTPTDIDLSSVQTKRIAHKIPTMARQMEATDTVQRSKESPNTPDRANSLLFREGDGAAEPMT